MKKTMMLLIVATTLSSVVGCGCCRRVRDWMCRGAICKTPAPVVAPQPVAACPACPPVTTAYDPGCGYEQTYGYGSYPVEGPSMIDSGWSSSCPDCSGPSYSLPSDSGSSYQYDSGSTSTIDPGPAN